MLRRNAAGPPTRARRVTAPRRHLPTTPPTPDVQSLAAHAPLHYRARTRFAYQCLLRKAAY